MRARGQGGGCGHQQRRQGPGDGQHHGGTPLALGEVRGDLAQGLRERRGVDRGTQAIFRLLQ